MGIRILFKGVLLPFLVLYSYTGSGQSNIDSLKEDFLNNRTDTARLKDAWNLYIHYSEIRRDSALYYSDQVATLLENMDMQLNLAHMKEAQGYLLVSMGKLFDAYTYFNLARAILEDASNEKKPVFAPFMSGYSDNRKYRLAILADDYRQLGMLMQKLGNYEEEISNYRQAWKISATNMDTSTLGYTYGSIGRYYYRKGNLDSASYFTKEAIRLLSLIPDKKYFGELYNILGLVFTANKKIDQAKAFFYDGLNIALSNQNYNGANEIYVSLTELYLNAQNKDSALFYARKSLETGSSLATNKKAPIFANLASALFSNKKIDSAFRYQKLAYFFADSVANIFTRDITEIQKSAFSDQLKLENLAKERAKTTTRTMLLIAIGVILFIATVTFFLYRNNRQKQAAKQKIETAYEELKSAQAMLIQSAKMASLGELTAGIAHEIQNPLNFVNNFSELNKDLLTELKTEIELGNFDQAATLAETVISNQEKINIHGKRADGIVKNMLLHSAVVTGHTEPTDINALSDEYLRLAFQGLRARDKSFKAKLETNYESNLDKLSVVPQDIGRVILNLINNALFAVDEKRKKAGEGYVPEIKISSRKNGKKVEVEVSDNGTGMNEKVVEKIFQPFFTTKATGQGTGLGLSISYDIIKAHGGEIKVYTKEGEGSKFIFELPS